MCASLIDFDLPAEGNPPENLGAGAVDVFDVDVSLAPTEVTFCCANPAGTIRNPNAATANTLARLLISILLNRHVVLCLATAQGYNLAKNERVKDAE
jgi:hypothetical protein